MLNRRQFLQVAAAGTAIAVTGSLGHSVTQLPRVKGEWTSQYMDYGHQHATGVRFIGRDGTRVGNATRTFNARKHEEGAMIRQERELLQIWAEEKHGVELV